MEIHDRWAIKILAKEHEHRPEIVARFMDEARAAARVRHKHLVRVFHVERTPDGTCYMVLEHLDGGSLSRFLRTQGPSAPDLVLQIAAPVASAIRELHKAQIIHRDIKPDNILLIQRDGNQRFPVVLDLGVAHLDRNLATGPGTLDGTIIGTPSYMAPEQLRGEAVGPAADLFSLGILVYELATGRLPWQHEGETRSQYFGLSPVQLHRRHEHESPVDPRRHVPGMTDPFAHALLGPLAFDPNKRPKDERAYMVALAQASPADGIIPDGFEVLRSFAPELLDVLG